MFGIAHLERSAVTFWLLVVNVLVFLAQEGSQGYLTQLGFLYGPAIADGQWWRLLTYGFMHGSWLHLASNMFFLFALGPQLERALGGTRFALVWFGSLFGGALASLLFAWAQSMLGASGATMGMAATFALVLWLRGADIRQNPFVGLIALNLALPLLIPVISFWGHFGGAAAGALMGWLLVRDNRAGPTRAGALGAPSASLVAFGAGTVVMLAGLGVLAGQLALR